ncbi:MAG: WD40 repeat domain-containing protein, partial [Pseudomonadota bacterium]|nr:WD40 repeat domain-containing protein [Pseudomonadota bacterium]
LLYHVDRPQLIKYIPLGERPRPSVDRYARNAAFDTAPAAGLLVTGQEYGSGINVYQYHPDSQTLELLWSPR